MRREARRTFTLTSAVSLLLTEGLATCPSEEIKTDSFRFLPRFSTLATTRHEISHRQIEGARGRLVLVGVVRVFPSRFFRADYGQIAIVVRPLLRKYRVATGNARTPIMRIVRKHIVIAAPFRGIFNRATLLLRHRRSNERRDAIYVDICRFDSCCIATPVDASERNESKKNGTANIFATISWPLKMIFPLLSKYHDR